MSPLENALLIFRTQEKARGLYDVLFGGLYRIDWIVRYEKAAAFGLVLLAALFLFSEYNTRRPKWGIAARVAGILAFSLLVFLLNEPVDEVFINLRHSLHFAETGLFSFNQKIPIEGIVDFLPYFVLGCLSKLGLPLPELAFLQGWLGGLLCLWAISRILRTFALTGIQRNTIFLVLCANPTLIFNASIGFSSPIFSASILWTIAFLFFEPKRVGLGFCGLALIPLVRLEGGLASVLLLVGYFFQNRKTLLRNIALHTSQAVAIGLPIGLLSLYRLRNFGSIIPTPVKYKSSFGNAWFLRLGLDNFIHDLFSGYGFLAIAILLSALCLSKKEAVAAKLRNLFVPLTALGIFVLPYYISGGDWFPSAWGRYLLPFTLFSTMAAMIALCFTFEGDSRKRSAPSLAAFLVFLIILAPYLFFSSAYGLLRQDFKEWWPGRGNFRIQQLSMLGNHLKETTRVSDVIASSEVATVMYFAHREALDLLGVANPQIAERPITGTNLFRRHYPELVALKMPEFIYPGDFISTELSYESSREEVTHDINRLRLTFESMNKIFFGGPENLLTLGYRPVVVVFGNRFSAMYYVSPAAWPSHFAKLIEKGFEQRDNPAPLLSRR